MFRVVSFDHQKEPPIQSPRGRTGNLSRFTSSASTSNRISFFKSASVVLGYAVAMICRQHQGTEQARCRKVATRPPRLSWLHIRPLLSCGTP
eukprot:749435-Hanusia_phi.AAC.1